MAKILIVDCESEKLSMAWLGPEPIHGNTLGEYARGIHKCGLRHGGTCENPEPLPPIVYVGPDLPDGCTCAAPPHRPPCSWCENQADPDVDPNAEHVLKMSDVL